MEGDKKALFEIAPYFDSKKRVIENLGYHIIQTNESEIAKRIVNENCIFTDREIVITEKTTSKYFLEFLKKNSDKIIFSKLADEFLITPLELRTVRVDFREISEIRNTELKQKYSELLNKEWVKKAKIDTLNLKKDPRVLLLIASELYKIRDRFNKYNFNQSEYIELLQSLTNFEIGVENDKKELTWHIDKEFNPDASLNLLIYFAGNFSKFRWDTQNLRFKIDHIDIKQLGKEDGLFQLLGNENDSIALNAFTQLTIANSERVTQLADEYEKANIERNDAIPIFPYRFLKQMVILTEYCKTNHIDFLGSVQLRAQIKKLDSEDLPFSERRKLENRLINTLTLNEITALEYWGLIKEESWGTTHSMGRILDIFYSKNWNQLLNSESDLKLYLKKSYLYDNLGIIGVCNKYLEKFTNNGADVSARLDQIHTEDNDIKIQIRKAKTICLLPIHRPNDTMKVNDANKDFNLTNIEAKIRMIKYNGKGFEKMEDELVELLSQINYSQIGTALREIENIVFVKESWKKYTFMERDWGFLIEESFDSASTRNNFLKLYDKLSEYELYAYYLDKAEIDYKNQDGSLNYDKIYDILKYNIVTAFVGGGGGRMDNEEYSIIKLLELIHNTTLGYPKKLCNSNAIYGCDSYDRANEWMQYLKDNKLLKQSHDEPVSFNYQ
jgi:hypothetical protein